MQLNQILKDVNVLEIKGDINQGISSVTCDSRLSTPDSLFVCIKGYKTDGNQFIDMAIEKGANCIVTEDNMALPEGIAFVKVSDARIALAQIANTFYDYPSMKFNLIGVTGTNGKTTTTYLIKAILEEVGQKVGLIGTISNKIGDEELPADRTTPDAVELQRLFNEMVQKGVQSVVMEVSSHSLDLHRVDGSQFDVGIFTNLTQDHLDFHGNLENYLNAKIKLFDMSKYGIINIDDQFGKEVIKRAKCSTSTFGINNDADLKAKNIVVDEKGSSFVITHNSKDYDVWVGIPGGFTAYNALGAISACLKLGVSMEDIIKGLRKAKVPGRSEVIDTGRDFTIIIDYAHTPDGVENILNSVRQFTKGRLVTLFGCGGDRDKTKRPIMGEIAGKLSDFCIVTSDNPRTEEPMQIINQVEEGVKRTVCDYVVIESRRNAIEYAIMNAKKDDVIVLAGKGHETYQILKDKTIHFDEREVIQEVLESLK